MTPPAIRVSGLVKNYGKAPAVCGVDLEVQAGECVGLLGPNGAGKTSTLEILEGLRTATAGEVQILGLDWSTSAAEIRARIGILFQETTFPRYLKTREVVELFRSFWAKGYSVAEALAVARLEEKSEAAVLTLSGGQAQRLAFAVALVGDPEVVFLDEPSTGLDPQSRQLVWESIRVLKQRGRAILLTTHYMEEAAQLCDRIVIIDRGRVIASGTPEQLISRHGGSNVVELAHEGLTPELFSTLPGLVEVNERPGCMLLSVEDFHRALPGIFRLVDGSPGRLQHVTTRQPTLDDVFLALTGRSLREAA